MGSLLMKKGAGSSESQIIVKSLFYNENNIFLNACFPNCGVLVNREFPELFFRSATFFFEGFPILMIIYAIRRHRFCIISVVVVRSKSFLVESMAEDDAANIQGFDKSKEDSIRGEGVKNRRIDISKHCELCRRGGYRSFLCRSRLCGRRR